MRRSDRARHEQPQASAAEPAADPELPAVSQPMPLVDPAVGKIEVTELSELQARAVCAREDIPIFWPRRDRHKRAA